MRNPVWLMLLATVLMIGGCGDTSEAGRVVDDFYEALETIDYEAWETVDADAAAALFTTDGVFVDKNGDEWVGRSEIASFVEMAGPKITRCRRTGDAESLGDGSFVFPIEITFVGADYVGEVALTLEDDLIARHDWKTRP